LNLIMAIGLLLIGCFAVWLVPAKYRLVAWLVVILVVVTPWRTHQDHAHWNRVRWVPFISPPVRVGDILGNIMLYVPFGLFYGAGRHGRPALRSGIAQALIVSTSTELTQLFSHSRFPSAQDILMNVAGAAAGMTLTRRAGITLLLRSPRVRLH
jgi:glycopeptide antibiotics resistance protein